MHRSRVLAAEGREGNLREMFQWYDEQSRAVYDPMRPELKTYSERGLPPAWKDDGADIMPELPALDRHRAAGRITPARARVGPPVTNRVRMEYK
jgi:hypothetical protein